MTAAVIAVAGGPAALAAPATPVPGTWRLASGGWRLAAGGSEPAVWSLTADISVPSLSVVPAIDEATGDI